MTKGFYKTHRPIIATELIEEESKTNVYRAGLFWVEVGYVIFELF